MKAYENELLSIFEELKDNAVITLRDVDKLMGKVSKCATSISNQRNELEQSIAERTHDALSQKTEVKGK